VARAGCRVILTAPARGGGKERTAAADQ